MTTPIVVQTGGLGEALEQIGTALGEIRDPDRERREAFENMLISTPGALSRVAQDIRQNPELAQGLFDFISPEMREAIAGAPQTVEQRVAGLTQRGLDSLIKQQGQLVGQITAANALGQDPKEIALLEEQLRIIQKEIVENQRREEQVEATGRGEPGLITRGVQRGLAGGETRAQIAEGRVTEDIANRAFDRMQVLPQAAVDEAALRNQLEEFFFDEDNRQAHDQRMALAGLTGPGAAEPGALERARLNAERTEAIRQARITNVGTDATWNTFLFDRTDGPDNRTPNERGIALAQGTIPVTSQEDADLAAVGSAWLRQGDVRRAGEISSQLAVVERLADSIEERDANGNLRLRATREAFVEQMNASFVMLNNLSKTPENPEGTIPLREAFIPGSRNAPFRVRNPVTGEELRVDPGPNFLQRIWAAGAARFGRSAPTERGGEQPQSRIEEERGQVRLDRPPGVPAGTVENLPALSPVTVDMGLLSGETSINNLLLIQQGTVTFKEVMDRSPSAAIDILRALMPEFLDANVQALIDSLIRVEIEKRDGGLKPEDAGQGGINQ